MRLLEWGPNDTTKYEITGAELREIVLECSVAYAKGMAVGGAQTGEWARAKKLGTMIRTITSRPRPEGP